ncbi:unnamed protein product [Zymoseptoria tritici ST99CH_1E4]|uniref:Zn(2)-C6 fungal-type domain-containing protein n=1 Tax=Zymoseptoria tritici ST99CH_1E4 TaxID=1276532 RepID=A0A2H1GGT8_ZYMTR|nr:unnamed protein product [Zymoseptoria tritici ST99CH_1E4]
MPPLGVYFPQTYPHQMIPPQGPLDLRTHSMQSMSMESLSSYSEFEDQRRSMQPQTGPQRSRRRQASGSDHVKHRRTRSGCYTCRQRRVKCDETHPICERCRKGKRECNYPGTTSSSKASKAGSRSRSSPGGSSQSGSEEDTDEHEPLSAIPDDEEEEDANVELYSATSDYRRPFGSPLTKAGSGSPPLDESSRASTTRSSILQPVRRSSKSTAKSELSSSRRWASLPKDVRFYLKYHRETLTHHHYAFKYDGGDFLRTTFLEIAINDASEALLYAVVAFSAYHHAVAQNDNRISTFLNYYNKAIINLQQHLKGKRHNVATLLTILQLATIEEFLGDWVNLLGHQKAAYQILTDLFTPQTIMQDETRRKIIVWYIRFDLFAGMMSGGETSLDREWLAASADFYKRQTTDKPHDIGARLEEYFATSRLLATDVALLFAGRTKNAIDDEQFSAEVERLTKDFADFSHTIKTAFTDPSYFQKTFPRAPKRAADDLFNFRDPNALYAGELSAMNFVIMDFMAIELMFKYQLAMASGQQPPAELGKIAMKKCKLLEAIEYGDDSPTALLGCQASLGIMTLFLPKTPEYTTWCRRKFALVEQLGYMYPVTLRLRMSELWGEDVSTWWLPNDEGFHGVIRIIRDFIDYRATRPTDEWTTGLRDMSGIFRSLKIEEHTVSDDLRSSSIDSGPSPWKHESSPDAQQPWP